MARKFYKKSYDKDLLAEILKKNAKLLTKKSLMQSQKSNKQQKSSKQSLTTLTKNNIKDYYSKDYSANKNNNKGNANKINTIFKSIGHFKNKGYLANVLDYVLKNTSHWSNDMGENIDKNQIKNEIKRFDLLEDSDNLKAGKKNVIDKNLSHRQLWHCVFSLPTKLTKQEDIGKFNKIMVESIEEVFVGHKFNVAVHSNTNNTHAHIIIKEKNDLTKKQLRLSKQDLFAIHKKLALNCIKNDLYVQNNMMHNKAVHNKTKIAKSSNKVSQPVVKAIKLANCYHKNAKEFVKMYYNNSFVNMLANQSTIDALNKLKMDDKAKQMFLNLYNENKSLAIWAINNNYKLFNIDKPTENFSLRKVKLENGKLINEKTKLDKVEK